MKNNIICLANGTLAKFNLGAKFFQNFPNFLVAKILGCRSKLFEQIVKIAMTSLSGKFCVLVFPPILRGQVAAKIARNLWVEWCSMVSMVWVMVFDGFDGFLMVFDGF